MYSPRQFQEHRPEVLHALIQQHPLGILVSQKPGYSMPGIFPSRSSPQRKVRVRYMLI